MSNTPIKDTKPPKNRAPQNFIEAAKDFERSKTEEMRKSRKVAWVIAGVTTAITSVSIIAFLVALLMRTEPEPVILKVDNSTGATTVMRSVKDAYDKYDDVVNKYWLAMYVRYREGYDWYTISQQFESVKLMSENAIATEYENAVKAENAPLAILKDKAKIIAKINAITFIGDTAQIRFTTEKESISGENPDGSPVQKWIATVAYLYDAGQMTEQQRLINPLGFKVVSYRVDPEVIQ